MKNNCKHTDTSILGKEYSISHSCKIVWCKQCGSTKYDWDTPEYNKKYGKWKSPRDITNGIDRWIK